MKIKWNGSKFAFAVGALQLSMAFHIFRLMSDKWKKKFCFYQQLCKNSCINNFQFHSMITTSLSSSLEQCFSSSSSLVLTHRDEPFNLHNTRHEINADDRKHPLWF